MLKKSIKVLDLAVNKYVTGIHPRILNEIFNITGRITKGAGTTLNVRAIEELGEKLETFDFKEEVLDKAETADLGPVGATYIRLYILGQIPLFIKIAKYSRSLREKEFNDEEIQNQIEMKFGEKLEEVSNKIIELEKQISY